MKIVSAKTVSRYLIILTGGLLLTFYCLKCISQFGNQYLYYPEPFPENETVSAADFPYEDVFFETEDHVRLHGWLAKHQKPEHYILFFHGNAGNLLCHSKFISILYHQLNATVFCIDYRGFGKSEGNPSEQGLYRDGEAALKKFREICQLSDQQITVVGFSLGGAVAVELTCGETSLHCGLEPEQFSEQFEQINHFKQSSVSFGVENIDNSAKKSIPTSENLNPSSDKIQSVKAEKDNKKIVFRPHALILISTFPDIRCIAQRVIKLFPASWVISEKYNSADKLPNYQGPLMIGHGTDDALVPFEFAKKNVNAAKNATPNVFFAVKNAGHIHSMTPEFMDALQKFLEQLPPDSNLKSSNSTDFAFVEHSATKIILTNGLEKTKDFKMNPTQENNAQKNSQLLNPTTFQNDNQCNTQPSDSQKQSEEFKKLEELEKSEQLEKSEESKKSEQPNEQSAMKKHAPLTISLTLGVFLILALIGLSAGTFGGMVGLGGGVIMIPALIYFLGVSQHDAQGISLMVMLPPISFFAVWNYWKAANYDPFYLTASVIIAIFFVIGGYYGSKIALGLSKDTMKTVFAVVMILLSLNMIFESNIFHRHKNSEPTDTQEQPLP